MTWTYKSESELNYWGEGVCTFFCLPQAYISQALKNLVPFCFWADWAVRAELKISAILLRYLTFEGCFSSYFIGQILHYLQEYRKIWNIAKSNKSELWNHLSYRGLPYLFEVRSQTFRNNHKISRSQPQNSTSIVIRPQRPRKAQVRI